MNRNVLFCLILAAPTFALAGCLDEGDSYDDQSRDGDLIEPTSNKGADNTRNNTGDNTATKAADNTGVNERDRDDATVTPFDQAENGPDIQITAEIRRAVVGSEDLGTNAENVKIITSGGVVTLRGPVATEAEKASIEAKATAVAGVTRVDNQLDVQPE